MGKTGFRFIAIPQTLMLTVQCVFNCVFMAWGRGYESLRSFMKDQARFKYNKLGGCQKILQQRFQAFLCNKGREAGKQKDRQTLQESKKTPFFLSICGADYRCLPPFKCQLEHTRVLPIHGSYSECQLKMHPCKVKRHFRKFFCSKCCLWSRTSCMPKSFLKST